MNFLSKLFFSMWKELLASILIGAFFYIGFDLGRSTALCVGNHLYDGVFYIVKVDSESTNIFYERQKHFALSHVKVNKLDSLINAKE
jgi:hypothetical protein